MRIKKIMIAILSLILLLVLFGCQLALEDAGESSEDRLIGVLVTTEYLDSFNTDHYLHDNMNKLSNGGKLEIEGDSNQYQGRIYASFESRPQTDEYGNTTDIREFVFENTEGISYFAATIPANDNEESYIASGSDEAIADGNMELFIGDGEEKTILKGTIYVSSSNFSNKIFYFNPVYQSDDGNVYVVAGSSGSMGGDSGEEGGTFSLSLKSDTTSRENGNSKSVSCEVTVTITAIYSPKKIIVLQMDEDSNVLSKEEYIPGDLPSVFTLSKNTSYIIVETYKQDYGGATIVTRSMFDKDDEAMETFYSRDDGICVKQLSDLDWDLKNH